MSPDVAGLLLSCLYMFRPIILDLCYSNDPAQQTDSSAVYEIPEASTPKPKNQHYQNTKVGAVFWQKKAKSPKPPTVPIKTYVEC